MKVLGRVSNTCSRGLKADAQRVTLCFHPDEFTLGRQMDGTIRKAFGESIEANSVHGSDSAETAATEIAFFFSERDIVG